MISSKSVIAIPPGATIREQLDTRGMLQKEFATRMGMSEKHISNLINGKAELTHDVALRLESVLGVPARFWNNLEAIYREKIERATAENTLESDMETAKKMPYSEMAKKGWVEATKDINQKIINLRSFFEVARLDLVDNLRIPGIAYRKMGSNDHSDYILAAWAQKARIEARKIDCAPLNHSKLESIIPEIRKMTTERPSEFSERLVSRFAECGIALVFLPHIGGSYLHGATFNDGNKIVMGLTVRGKDADRFWFSIMHEVHHVITGHINSSGETTTEQEKDADIFAKNTLIPPDQYEALLLKPMNKTMIINFAKDIGIDPGIIVGRLQKDNIIPFNRYNDLKKQYQIAE